MTSQLPVNAIVYSLHENYKILSSTVVTVSGVTGFPASGDRSIEQPRFSSGGQIRRSGSGSKMLCSGVTNAQSSGSRYKIAKVFLNSTRICELKRESGLLNPRSTVDNPLLRM